MLKSPLKILTVTPDFGHRGTQRVAQLFSVAFKQMGHDVAVLALAPGGPRRAAFAEAGITIIDAAKNFDETREQIRRFAPDVVHIHRAGPPQMAITILLQQLRPLSKLIVETNIFGRYDPSVRDLIDVHFQLTHTGLYRWNCLASPPHRRKSVSVYVPNPLDFSSFVRSSPAEIQKHRREKWGVKEGEFVFGRIGKTAWELLGTFKDVVDKHPNVRLISLGENHDFQHIVDALPEHVRSRIVPLPPTNSDEELRLFYSSIDALLHWSYVGESFGMVLAEAIGCGTPVVMPLQLDKDIGGIEVIGHGEGGLIAGHGAILDQAALEMIRTRASFDNGPLQRARERMNREYEVNRVAAKAIEAFHLALDAKQNHRSLQDAFAERSEFVSFVSKKWFKDLISKRIGPTTLREQIRHRFTHNGWLVRARYRVVPPLPPETVLLSPAVVNSKAC